MEPQPRENAPPADEDVLYGAFPDLPATLIHDLFALESLLGARSVAVALLQNILLTQ